MLRVLHGPVNVGNQPWVLSRAERAYGVHSDLVVNYSTWFGYPNDRCLSEFGKRSLGGVLKRSAFAFSSPFRYDVLHYYFGRSFTCWDDYSAPKRFWFADLKMAKRLGRKIFMTFQGCDARLSDESSENNQFTACHLDRCESAADCRGSLDARRRKVIDEIVPLADRVMVLNPELARFVPGSVFMPYCSVDIEAFEPIYPQTGGTIKIVHAPSNESIKGSDLIIPAVKRLQERYPIELILVQGVPYEQALKIYQQADLIVDQLLVGWYGGFAVEAMALGKPVACYIRESDLDCLPRSMSSQIPLIRIDPVNIETALEQAIKQRKQWRHWGQLARDYVLRWHHPRRLAGAMVRAYRHPHSHFQLDTETESCAA